MTKAELLASLSPTDIRIGIKPDLPVKPRIRRTSAPIKAEPKDEYFAQGISIGRTYRNFEIWSNHFPVKFDITKECWIGRIYYIEYKQHIYYADKVLSASCSYYPDGSMSVKPL